MIWPVKKLGDILSTAEIFTDGDWVESKDQDVNGSIRLLQLADIGDGNFINKSNRFINESTFIRLKCTEVQLGDILIARMPDPLGRACIFEGISQKCITVVDVCIIRVDSNIVDARWLMHAINSDSVRRQISSFAKGATRVRISRKNLSHIQIEFPPLAEQQRIAAVLDTADRILKQRESAIAKLDQLTQSVFVELFSNDTKYECEEITLGDCLRFINGRAYSQNELLDAGTPVIRIQNLNGGDRWYYSNLNLPENKYCDYGDLLFAWSASFGPYIWNGEKSIYHYHIWKIETTKKIDKTFAYYLLQSITQKIRNASHGASMLHMTKSGIEAWKIKLPSLAYQMKFVDFINQLQPIETAYKKSLQLMTDNTKSIQHQSFAVN